MDNEVKGLGNQYDYGFRIYSPRIAKFLSVDPLSASFPWYTPYQYAGNKPIHSIDLDGLEEVGYREQVHRLFTGESVIQKQSEWTSQSNTFMASGNFWKASIYNTLNDNHNLYKNIRERHSFYTFAQNYIDYSGEMNIIASKWFGAAELVTQMNAVGGADWFDGELITSNETDGFLREGNEFLFSHNMKNFKGIMTGALNLDFVDANKKDVSLAGLSGKELDYALVEFEQTKVQEYIELYKAKNPDANMQKIFKEINSSFTALPAQPTVKKVIKDNFKDENGEINFNFSNYNDRVKLGQKLIDKEYE